MKLTLAIVLMVSCLFSGMAIGLSYATAEYASLLEQQSALINAQWRNLKQKDIIIDAWKKTGAEMLKGLRECEENGS